MHSYSQRLRLTLFAFVLALIAGSAAWAVPTLIQPADAESCVSYTTKFRWNVADNAVSYRLQVSDTNAFTIGRFMADTAGIVATNFTQTLNPDKIYFWRIIALTAWGAKDTSGSWTFMTKKLSPVVTNPLSKSNCNPLLMTFTWNRGPWQIFDIQVSESPNFDTLMLVSASSLDTSSYQTVLPKYSKKYYMRLRATLNQCISDWSVVEFTTMPSAPAIVSPAQKAKGGDIFTVPPFNTTLRWAKGDSVLHYTVQIADNPAFTSPIQYQVDTNFKDYSFGSLYNKSFYWRVKTAFATCESDWTAGYKLSTPYETPTLLSPEMNATCVALKPSFDWPNITGALGYRIQVSDSANFANLVQNVVFIGSSVFTGDLPNPKTPYFWRVRAEDSTNNGMWMTPGTFTTTINPPFVQYPVASSTGIDPDMTFLWSNVGTGATYSIMISEVIGDTTVVLVNTDTLTSNYFKFKAPKNNSVYRWTVAAKYGGCASAWGQLIGFKTVIPAPVGISPADSAVKVLVSTSFTWTAVDNALSYDIDISTVKDFSTLVRFERKFPNPKVIFTNLPQETVLYWRIRAGNAEGTSPWSKTYMLTTGKQIPASPVHISPANGSSKLPTTVELVWAKTDYAEKYNLQVAFDGYFDNLIIDSTMDSVHFLLEGLQNNKPLFWRVMAINNTGESEWSVAWTFRTISLPPTEKPLLTFPTTDAKDIQLSITFVWVPVIGATGYEFQLAKSQDFAAGAMVYESRNIQIPSQYMGSLKNDMVYYWRVRAWNDGGDAPWSEINKFTTISSISVREQSQSLISTTVYPQPALSLANISFDMKQAAFASVKIFDLKGNLLATPFAGNLNEGRAEIKWNTSAIESGIYIYSIEIGNYSETGRIAVVK